ncbi:MAG: hypothetical protein HRU18_06730 [Pseudoalteromonas sp.]|uniref:hypothetical protein n=1 Tax=Pseudoalteromonas sp. TaxID=53249 RepID=UPI001DE0FAB3|nr:hypothetical protein [Pseudoalteromonas sp.]NRA77885.1 hypothetical protein [Pseudoalteromonas sp.]
MDKWQDWAAVIVAFAVSTIVWNSRQEKIRAEKFREITHEKLSALSERVTRVETEMVTEREVREVLKELILPFVNSVARIENASTSMSSDLTEIRVSIAKLAKNET